MDRLVTRFIISGHFPAVSSDPQRRLHTLLESFPGLVGVGFEQVPTRRASTSRASPVERGGKDCHEHNHEYEGHEVEDNSCNRHPTAARLLPQTNDAQY